MPFQLRKSVRRLSGLPNVLDELLKRVLAASPDAQCSDEFIEGIRTRGASGLPHQVRDSPPPAPETPSCSDRHWLARYYPIGPGMPGRIVFHEKRIARYFHATLEHLRSELGSDVEEHRTRLCEALLRGIHAHEQVHFVADVERVVRGIPRKDGLTEEGLATAWERACVGSWLRLRPPKIDPVLSEALAWWFNAIRAPGYDEWRYYATHAEFDAKFHELLGHPNPPASFSLVHSHRPQFWCSYWIGGELPHDVSVPPSGWPGQPFSKQWLQQLTVARLWWDSRAKYFNELPESTSGRKARSRRSEHATASKNLLQDIRLSSDENNSGEVFGFTPIDRHNCPPAERREDYLADPHVSDFLGFLTTLLQKNGSLRHAWYDRRTNSRWHCESLLDAVDRYSYRIASQLRHLIGSEDHYSLRANALVLNRLQADLRRAVATSDAPAAQKAANEILLWGGTNRAGHNGRALVYLERTSGALIGYLRRCQAAFGSGAALNLLPLANVAPGIRSNAGFTKIYALAFEDFLIYDSRVAAALGMLIVRWWARKSHPPGPEQPIPTPLRLCHLPGMGDANRDPNTNAMRISGFPRCTSQLQHLQSNVRANWLLSHALRGTYFEAQIQTCLANLQVRPLRALEAALFMIGYDLGPDWSPLS